MKPISKAALNEMLVECSTLESVCFDLPSKTAVLTFKMESDTKNPESRIRIQCDGIFQIVLTAHRAQNFSTLGIEGTPTLAKIDEIAHAFRDQFIFEWELDCDEVVEVVSNSLQVFLMNEAAPSASLRGIGVFKDAEHHFQLLIIGTALWVVD